MKKRRKPWYKYFDSELKANKCRIHDRWTDDDGVEHIDYITGFEWYLTENFYTYEAIEHMLGDIKDTMYSPFFEALYHEFRQQSRKHPDQPVNPYKAERLNHILRPLKEMMQGEEYAEMLELIHTEGEESMSYSDAMILMTQYKCSLAKFHRDWR